MRNKRIAYTKRTTYERVLELFIVLFFNDMFNKYNVWM